MNLKKAMSYLLIVGLFLLLPANLTFAKDNQSGLQIKVTTDKQKYSNDEDVQLHIHVTNTLPVKGKNVVVTTTIPKGLQAIGSSENIKDHKILWKFNALSKYESKDITLELQRTDKKNNFQTIGESTGSGNNNISFSNTPSQNTSLQSAVPNKAPDTGDHTDILKYVIILVCASFILAFSICAIYKRNVSRFLSLLLIPSVLLAPFSYAKAEGTKISVSAKKEIQIDHLKYEIMTEAEASFDLNSLAMTNDPSLTVTAQKDGFKLSWREVNNAKSYQVLRKLDQDKFERIADTKASTKYADKNLKTHGIYTYKVVAQGYNGMTRTSDEVLVYASEFGNGLIPSTIDSDQDKLPDDLETVLGSNPNNADTDGDKLPDGYEYQYTGSSPLKKDTNGNGTSDDQEDPDTDELNNLKEYRLKTNPTNSDSDLDKLTDSDEVNKHHTQPANEDTDEDGLTDGNEILHGTDPLKKDTDGDGTVDGNETFAVTVNVDKIENDKNVAPSVTMNLQGKNLDKVSISKIGDSNPYLNSSIPGYIGSAYGFSSSESFNSAPMTFAFNKKLLDQPDFKPAIYYFNESTKKLEILPNQQVNAQKGEVSAHVSHFSSYILLNKTKFDEAWAKEMKPPHSGNISDAELVIGFAIDSSGSMTWNDPQGIRKQTAKEFVSKLDDNDKASVVDFDYYAQVLAPLTHDKKAIKDAIDSIDSYGGTDLAEGMRASIDELKDDHSNVKYIILLTDGMGYYDASLTQKAVDLGISVYTIGLGNEIDEPLLKRIATATGGKYYHASKSEDLGDIFDETSEETIDLTKDTDGDGLSDYHEKNGMRTSTGKWIKTDFQKRDTDEDKIKDGDEIIYKDGYFLMKSDPNSSDGDSDGINDIMDPQPMVYSVTDRTLALAAGLSYNNLNDRVGSKISDLVQSNRNFVKIESPNLDELKEWTIIDANDSGAGYWKDFWDSGLGSVAIKIPRSGQPDAVIFAARGTEPSSDAVNDFSTDFVLGAGLNSYQSTLAFNTYTQLAKGYPNAEFYLAGHSLGGRLVQDVFYKTLRNNEGIFGFFKSDIDEPVHSATFNALGYNKVQYWDLKNDIVSEAKKRIDNYYYVQDLVGQGLGSSSVFERIGREAGAWVPHNKNGTVIKPKLISSKMPYSFSQIHDITLFHNDDNLHYDKIPILK